MTTDVGTLLIVLALILAILSLVPRVAVPLSVSVILLCIALLVGGA
jgi:hypothetical protein